MLRRAVPLAALLSLAPLAAACGSSSSTTGSSTNSTAGSPTTGSPAPTTPTATGGGSSAPSPIPAADRSAPGTWAKEPTITVPAGAPPKVLESADLITGTGPAAASGDQVTVRYVGVSYTTKKVFDASWTDGHPSFSFGLGAGQVIPGWDQGVVGMKVGGRRELIIPPALAYGAQSPGAGIVANDTLIFIVDLVKIG